MITQSWSMADDRAAQVLVAEFQFVAGLIPFYRRAELIVLGATGALLSVMVAALATLEAADESQRQAEGILLALGAWVPVLLLLIEVMALTRIMRASRYIYCCLHPLACQLGRPGLLEFERSPSAELLAGMRGQSSQAGRSRMDQADESKLKQHTLREQFMIFFFSSTPLILVVAAASIGLAAGGILVDFGPLTLSFGLSAALGAVALACYGIASTQTHEARGLIPQAVRVPK